MRERCLPGPLFFWEGPVYEASVGYITSAGVYVIYTTKGQRPQADISDLYHGTNQICALFQTCSSHFINLHYDWL